LALRFGLGFAGAAGSASSFATSGGKDDLICGRRIFGPHSARACSITEMPMAKLMRRDGVSGAKLTG
jgi:hypothetical protein